MPSARAALFLSYTAFICFRQNIPTSDMGHWFRVIIVNTVSIVVAVPTRQEIHGAMPRFLCSS